MINLESLTIEQLAVLCGLKRDDEGDWIGTGSWTENPCVISDASERNTWVAYGNGGRGLVGDATEREALLALAQHLRDAASDQPVRYTRIERGSADDYSGYEPKAGDLWHFSRGAPWKVDDDRGGCYLVAPREEDGYYGISKSMRDMTTHIERPVRVVIVPKEGYEPKVGDRFYGPEGLVMTVSSAERLRTCFDSLDGGMHRKLVDKFVALATRIERDE